MDRKQQKEYTKRRIFETSLSLFMEHGYENVSIDTIVKSIGLTKGAFYHHFVSKDAILVEYCNNTIDSLTESLIKTVELNKEKEVKELLESLFKNFGDFLLKNHEIIHVLLTQSKMANISLEEMFIDETSAIFQNVLSRGLHKQEFTLTVNHEDVSKYLSVLLFHKLKESAATSETQKNISQEMRDMYQLFIQGLFK
ncbi:MAG TPA: TetR/AcrR family transcriptional regulator [Pseudoneobacillus sp.]|nr:TetR/AcrR family transcriptional regulator [Pseudoneobacillus sp.]